jgi:glutamate dehydrogenase/leucine dehydrogenase
MGGIYNEDGLNIPHILGFLIETGSVVDFPGADPISNEDLLTLPVDVLIPAALGEVITSSNADDVKAKVIIEGANHPITPVADASLNDRGIFIVPDILANAGGVIVSYFEWTQNIQQFRWEEDDINQRLEKRLVDAYWMLKDFCGEHDASRREAAFSVAVQRVSEAAHLRGYI